MKFKENYLVFILFVLLMLSLGSVAASENVNSDDADNHDLISLPVYSALEIDDNGNMPNDVNVHITITKNSFNVSFSEDLLNPHSDS